VSAEAASGAAWSGAVGERARRVIFAVALLLLLFDLLSFFAGDAPLDALVRAASGTWGTPYGIGQVLYKATPLLFAGVAFDIAYRAGLFNIGVEGQMALASLTAGVVAAALPQGTPFALAVPIVLLSAAVVGGLWASIAGALRAWAGAHEVIATIMLNRIADALVPLLLNHGLGATGFRTRDAVAGARLPSLGRLAQAFEGSAVSVAFLLSVAASVGAWAWLRRSRVGREIGWVGQGADVCRAEGIPVGRRLVLAMALSGAVAGLAVSATVLGYKGYHETGLGAGAGFGGIAVALLGKGRPLGLIGAALLVGTLQQAGLVLNATLPREAMDVLFGAVILAVAASPFPEGNSGAPGARS
jgi:general nucleoside transport system permease protein